MNNGVCLNPNIKKDFDVEPEIRLAYAAGGLHRRKRGIPRDDSAGK